MIGESRQRRDICWGMRLTLKTVQETRKWYMSQDDVSHYAGYRRNRHSGKLCICDVV